MYVDTAPYVRSGKTHKRYLLRESYREDGKVKKRTIASLCTLKIEEINAIKLALTHKEDLNSLASIKNAEVLQGKSYGAILAIRKVAHELGIINALGNSKNAKIALWQVIGRVLFQGSRLSLLRALDVHAAQDMLSLPQELTAKQLYTNLSWLEKNQLQIEKTLQNQHKVKANLYLYDVTSSYLEGSCNEIAEYGYNRDKKKGKKQIVIGLLTNSEGNPVAVRVFKGNTSDPTTVPDQINLLQDEFKVKKVTLVGDRAMLTKTQIKDMPEGFSYITAIGKQQIKKLINDEILQMSLFDTDLQEVETEQNRYILRCNPMRKEEISTARQNKIESAQKKLEDKNKYLSSHPRAKPDIALREVNNYINKLNINKFVSVSVERRIIKLCIDKKSMAEEAKLDGCYCLVTDIISDDADKDTIHSRYKDLAMVEYAFRTMKQSHLEIRPLYLRREDRTKGHVFITMLAYMIQKKLAEYWKELNITVTEGLSALTTLGTSIISVAKIKISTTIKPTGVCKNLLKPMKITIPQTIGVHGHC